ncbi:hypothetical protein K490DRAFT_57899 [Saccharata proteae CBS 121410]|uniref:2EXR domain-containing protein n=1 Tax=Saccharata proteae CBS 121410 TaxID=1314787 RepID=A0A9P4HTP7_9PEZI|nr:hypothetical protein K490DRAFT_57899 [Saccharata proteae CBS 121410]
MTEPAAPQSYTLRSSKRKRAPVSYLEIDSQEVDSYADGDLHDEDYQSSVVKSSKRNNNNKKRKTTTSRSSKKPFPFLRLPAEIRNQIYEYCLSDPNGLHLRSTIRIGHRRTVRRHPAGPKLSPALLAVNKQMHAEARSFLYPDVISLENSTALHHFVANLSRHCTNVARIEIDCSISMCGVGPKQVAHRIYRDTYRWLEAVGRETGTWDEGVRRIKVLSDEWYGRSGRMLTQEVREACARTFEEELRMLVKDKGKGLWWGRRKRGKGPSFEERT